MDRIRGTARPDRVINSKGRKARTRVYCREREAIIPACGRAGCGENIRTSAFPPAPESPPRCVVRGILKTIPVQISPAEQPRNGTETEESSTEAGSGLLRGMALRCTDGNF